MFSYSPALTWFGSSANLNLYNLFFSFVLALCSQFERDSSPKNVHKFSLYSLFGCSSKIFSLWSLDFVGSPLNLTCNESLTQILFANMCFMLLEMSPDTSKILGLNLPGNWEHFFADLHVLSVHVLVFSKYFGFLTDVQIKSTGYSILFLDMNVPAFLCVSLVIDW